MRKLLLFIPFLFLTILTFAQAPNLQAKGQKDGSEDSVKERSSSAIRVYPNPAANDLNIDLGTQAQKGEIILYNIAGNEVLRQDISSFERIDISGLRDGFYFYEIFGDGKLIQVGRVIKK
jgi:hypothetical protein